ncbi:shikimate kinase [Acinetobacter sp. TR3]|jgi:adenylate kinase family enzyme|uniref:shikimate kinase n=1 Tax=Acinetobacter sp. TR3 TaxID=3003392 RepID=UPI0022AC4690|nr:shikimate kinase [Acinetobacter sp. TR3]WAU75965.1 adenylate kinase [Acinetobacter sp. TR3]
MKFINVIGTTGSGKSTFARLLAQKQQLQYIEMDDLFWLDDWQEPTDEVFFEKLKNKMDRTPGGWVLDGNYTRTMSLKLVKIDTIVWLDYSFSRNFSHLIKRSLFNLISQRKLWENSNNRESLKLLFSKQSIFIWLIQQYPRNKTKYQMMMQDQKYQHIQFIHLTSPKQAAEFLQQIKVVQ